MQTTNGAGQQMTEASSFEFFLKVFAFRADKVDRADL